MARSISEIKNGITSDWMNNGDVARIYGFERGTQFSTQFSRVSVENLLFYIVACSVWVLEKLMDSYRTEVETYIDSRKPHTPRWYRDKALAFMKGHTLYGDTDGYNTEGLEEAEIEKASVIRYAAASESADASILTVKVAGETGGVRTPLDSETFRQFSVYMSEIKDAGVRLNLVNLPPDRLSVEVDVYFNPLLSSRNVETECRAAITRYIANLPFNGEYTNMALIDTLQQVEGVRIAELQTALYRAAGENVQTRVNARTKPVSGYFEPERITLNMKEY